MAIGGPFAFLYSTLLFAGLDRLKDRMTSRARLIGIGVVLGAVLGYVSIVFFSIASDTTEDWVTLLEPQRRGPFGPAVLIGGAVLGFRLAWTCRPAILLPQQAP